MPVTSSCSPGVFRVDRRRSSVRARRGARVRSCWQAGRTRCIRSQYDESPRTNHRRIGPVKKPVENSRGGEASNAPAIRLSDVQEAAELRRRLTRFLAHGDATVRRCGLTPQRYRLMLAVKGAPDGSEARTVGGIAADLQLAQSSATELVDRAEAAWLVVR